MDSQQNFTRLLKYFLNYSKNTNRRITPKFVFSFILIAKPGKDKGRGKLAEYRHIKITTIKLTLSLKGNVASTYINQ